MAKTKKKNKDFDKRQNKMSSEALQGFMTLNTRVVEDKKKKYNRQKFKRGVNE